MEKKITDFYTAYTYLEDHDIFKDDRGYSRFQDCLDIDVVKLNPETECIEPNPILNTETNVWLECGPYLPTEDNKRGLTHDIDLDSGGKTFEEAIIELANLVLDKFDIRKHKKDEISLFIYQDDEE